MSRSMNMMVAARKSLIDKYTILSFTTQSGRKTRFLEFYGGSQLYDYFEKLASDCIECFRPEYFDDPLEELYFVPFMSNNNSQKQMRQPYFLSVSVLQSQLNKLWDLKIEPSDEKEYDEYLEQNRRLKIESIHRLLGQIDLIQDTYDYIDYRLIFWVE